MRHAKSDWDADYGSDHERPLNERGVRSAKVIGGVLRDRSLDPQHIITSSAVRARTTAELAVEAGGWEAQIELEGGLYGTGPEAVVAIASHAPEVDRLMLVGHQPTWSLVAAMITGQRVEMKTATVAVIDCPIDTWRELPSSGGDLIEVIHARTFMEDSD